jgi:hypothetical protein
MYPPLSDKPQNRAKHLLYRDQVILRLHQLAGPKKLFSSKGIQTLNLMEMLPRPRPLPLEQTPLVRKIPKI